ncbi:MAG: FkbM family methyltransferase [Bdellovibrionales bacterium]|nr:FkbM family methyltransferase [Bdellovibrionales bacterium]
MNFACMHAFLALYFRLGLRGFHFLNRWLNHGGPLQVRCSYGTEFLLRPGSYIDDFVISEGYYESEIIEAIKALDWQKFRFWDIGSNIGLHAITVAALFPDAEVIAFEPLPDAYARLLEHQALNGVSITDCNFALMDRAGSQAIFTDSSGFSGQSCLIEANAPTGSVSFKVDCQTAASMVERFGCPHIVKIDVEGAELNVLQGFKEQLQNPDLQVILFEEHADLLDAREQNPVFQLLSSVGFSIAQLQRRERTVHALENFIATRFSL